MRSYDNTEVLFTWSALVARTQVIWQADAGAARSAPGGSEAGMAANEWEPTQDDHYPGCVLIVVGALSGVLCGCVGAVLLGLLGRRLGWW